MVLEAPGPRSGCQCDEALVRAVLWVSGLQTADLSSYPHVGGGRGRWPSRKQAVSQVL